MEVQEELKHQQLLQLFANGKRADGRGKLDYREIQIIRDPLQNAEGSALCTIGRTQVICGVKIDLATPFPDRPTEGVLSTGAEFTPLGSHLFEPGPPKVEAIELARVTDRAIRSANMINLASLAIPGMSKVKAVYVDLWIADHDGNLFDAGSIAAMSALLNTRVPKYEDGKAIREESSGKLKVENITTSTTFAKIMDRCIVDPTANETNASYARLTVSTDEENVRAMQKGLSGGFSAKEVEELVEVAFNKHKEQKDMIKRSQRQ